MQWLPTGLLMATDDSHDPSTYPASILANRDSREESRNESVSHNPYPFLSGKINQDRCLPTGEVGFFCVVSLYMGSTEYLCVFIMQLGWQPLLWSDKTGHSCSASLGGFHSVMGRSRKPQCELQVSSHVIYIFEEFSFRDCGINKMDAFVIWISFVICSLR